MIIIIIAALDKVYKGLLKGHEILEKTGRVETTQTTTLLRTIRIPRRVLETWGDLLSLKLPWKTISYHWCEKLWRSKIILIIKESEKKDRYFGFTREQKKLWNMKVTFMPIIIGALGTVTKGLIKGLEDLEIKGRVETIQTTALLRSVRILRRVLETRGDLAVTQTSVKGHQPMLMWRILKELQ